MLFPSNQMPNNNKNSSGCFVDDSGQQLLSVNCCFTDQQTGCHQVSCVPAEKTAYEACRQSYFLKQQNQIVQSQTVGDGKSQQLQGLLDTQQKQMQTLTQQVDSQNQRVNTLTNQLNTSNIINISLAVMLLLVLILGILIFVKNYGKHKIIFKK